MAMLRAVERMEECPLLPEPRNKRRRLGQDLQPVGDYAGIEPYYRVCEDAGAIQHQDKSDPEVFHSDDWWWNQRRIRFLSGKAFVGLSILLLLIPYTWGGVVLAGGGISIVYLSIIMTEDAMDLIRMVAVLGSAIIWIPLSLYILIKTMPWVMGVFALLLRPFDKLLSKLLDRGLEAGESYFNRETG